MVEYAISWQPKSVQFVPIIKRLNNDIFGTKFKILFIAIIAIITFVAIIAIFAASIVGDVGASFCCTQCVNCQVSKIIRQNKKMANISFQKDKMKTIANNLFLDWSGDPGETGRRAGSGWKIILKCLKNPPKNCWKIILKCLINPKKIASMSL